MSVSIPFEVHPSIWNTSPQITAPARLCHVFVHITGRQIVTATDINVKPVTVTKTNTQTQEHAFHYDRVTTWKARWSAAAWLRPSRVRIPLRNGGLRFDRWHGLITPSQESYRVCMFVV
jgi:hypothetical protein